MGSGSHSVLICRYHETCRVFQDRLVCDEDRQWLDQLIRGEIQDRFKLKPDEVLDHDPILFGDLMYPNSEKKPYSEVTGQSHPHFHITFW